MLALTVFMAFAGLFFSQVVDIWDAHARYSDFLLPSVLAGPAVFCIFGVPALIWPGRVTGLFSWAWVVWIFGSKWADKFHFTTTDLAAGVFVLMTLAVGISFWAVGRRQSPGVTGA